MQPPSQHVPMLVVGSSRQSVQWIAQHADAWATYHREEDRQQNRIRMWQQALEQRAQGEAKPFIQSLQLDLLDDPKADAEPINLGMRCGREALIAYLHRIQRLGVAHVLLNLVNSQRTARDVVAELGTEVLPQL